MKSAADIRAGVVKACRELDRREYVGGRDGNVSALLPDGSVVVTPAGMRKGDVALEHLLVVDRKGKVVGGRGRASTELGMHLRIYELRADVRAVVHAHPPVATGFAAAGVALKECVLPEVIVGLGRVPIAPYATPGTPEVSRALDDLVAKHDAILLANHGAVTVGEDVDAAYQRLETVEQAARILLVARLLGGAQPLSPSEVAELVASRARYGVREGLAACDVAPAGALSPEEEALAARIAARVRERLSSR
ncbi:MAG: class II aldolase/adducin family protein [bacterium]